MKIMAEGGEQPTVRKDIGCEQEVIGDQDRILIAGVRERVGNLGEFLGIPPEAIERGKRTEVYVVSPEDLAREVTNHLKSIGLLPETDFQDLTFDAVAKLFGTSAREIKDQRVARAVEEVKKIGGISLPQEHGRSLVLVRDKAGMPRNEVIDHELLHAMADREPGGKTGFQESDGKDHVLNEATVEVLRLACTNPNDSPDVLWSKMKKGELRSPHTRSVSALLGAMVATHLGERPVAYQELSEAYFEGDGLGFKMDLVSRSHSKHRRTSKKLVEDNFGI